VFGPDGQPRGQWGSYGAAPGEVMYPHGIAVDARGTVYVADSSLHRVQAFSPTGQLLAVAGGRGGGPGQLREQRIRLFGKCVQRSGTNAVRRNPVRLHGNG
jgi:DNA-binding beta-propeller fold protein YncE